MAPSPSVDCLKVLRRLIVDAPLSSPRRANGCICAKLPRAIDAGRRHLSGSSNASQSQETSSPVRKQLKEEARSRKRGDINSVKSAPRKRLDNDLLSRYELTVGLEIHAELNTVRKLFSSASTSLSANPNSHVSHFDSGFPGAQPQFQRATLLPAIRAALALNCEVQHKSSWDRKHYFWWDQPNGYQITQYYRPFALHGSLTLLPSDVPTLKLREPIVIGIKQIQMEQDTAKTTLQPPDTHLIDFNRVSHPLIEIISLPQIHDPEVAAASVRKIQGILKAVGACETGMEMGGLRCDVNVSVKSKDPTKQVHADLSYAGVSGLGQRTEIKNLSSVVAVAAAIAAERDRQIELLESGGRVAGETRGWTLGATTTHHLRGKEGEVDYRYIPDADLPPLLIGQDLVEHLRQTLPALPEQVETKLVRDFGVSPKDAATLVDLDEGDRVEYYYDVVGRVMRAAAGQSQDKAGRAVSNWVLHELGALMTTSQRAFDANCLPANKLADILVLLLGGQITLPTAKSLLSLAFEGSITQDIESYVDANGLRLQAMSDEEYVQLANTLVNENVKMAEQAAKEAIAERSADQGNADGAEKSSGRRKKGGGKMMWFVGQMVRQGEAGRVQPERAEKAVRQVLLEKNAT